MDVYSVSYYFKKLEQKQYNTIQNTILTNTAKSVGQKMIILVPTERPTPVVLIQPDKEVFSGETVTLRCVIQGGGVSNWEYSWSKGGSSTPVSNVQQYSISSVTQSHSGTYTCRGTVSGTSRSSHTSKAVTRTVSGECDLVLCFLHTSQRI